MRILYFCLIALGLFFTASVSAQEGGGEAVVCPAPPSCDYFDKWDEYKCTSVCDADIQKRTCWIWQTLEVAPGGGECPAFYCATHNSCAKEGQYPESNWTNIDACLGWQGCGPQGVLRNKSPECSCSGACIEPPEKPRYYDDPGYTDRTDKDKGNTNLAPPIKFDWDDVEGWKVEPDGPKSYLLNLNTAKGTVSKVLDISEYAGLRKDQGACFLEANSDYSWQASACCSSDGQNCGQPSSWGFHTSLAPELVSPDDPDWAGEKGAEGIVPPVTLDWCDVKNANSYRFRVFYVNAAGKKVCHPALTMVASPEEEQFLTAPIEEIPDFCDSWVLEKEWRDPEQREKILYSDFTDKDWYFFTKDTAIDWQVKACGDDQGLEWSCGSYSQLWSFDTAKIELPEFVLFEPPHDPAGQIPVGLPLVLNWQDKEGVNSFLYQLNPLTGTLPTKTSDASQSRSFDYPELSLDTFYRWKALDCFDYDSKRCETEWSVERIFKTTGRPPILLQPAAGASGIPIPANLSWEAVPGAKSYILTVRGDVLNLTEIINDKSEFSIEWPKRQILQEKTYTWQVKTCAHKNGQACGNNSQAQTFQTFKIPPPTNPSPQNNQDFPSGNNYISWDGVNAAKAYQYRIKYLSAGSEEKNQDCLSSAGKEVVPEKIAPTQSDFVQLSCLGRYEWQARSCLDESCSAFGYWSDPWAFSLLEPTGVGKAGLAPCGKSIDNPRTPWNEREPCQIDHIFLLVKVVIEFLLFRVIPLLLVLLTVYSALTFYLSIGKASALAGIIALWKSVGIGLGFVFLGWTVVNLFIKLIKSI